jgi:hypothetical protein
MCWKHTRVHTIQHMGFWRWLWVTLQDPVWTVKRQILRWKSRRAMNKAVEKWRKGETTSVELQRQISMVKRK